MRNERRERIGAVAIGAARRAVSARAVERALVLVTRIFAGHASHQIGQAVAGARQLEREDSRQHAHQQHESHADALFLLTARPHAGHCTNARLEKRTSQRRQLGPQLILARFSEVCRQKAPFFVMSRRYWALGILSGVVVAACGEVASTPGTPPVGAAGQMSGTA